ncbi:hypothetical protein U9M48_036878 [Paspalum notatum var. saurae]|uniref:Uncharacterized protein n=1 Tax=Paspalum notatum var. saurae TaxID=547442 RepID=A0AAQ3X8P7_PASNO
MDHDSEEAMNMKLLLCAFEQLSVGSFPFRYLGIPMHYRKLRNADWRTIEERFENRLSSWKGKLLSQNDQHKKKYRIARWEIVCMPKYQGGLGILDLDTQNKCLLGKWLFKLTNEDGLWQRLLRNKYLRNKILTQLEKKPGDSILEQFNGDKRSIPKPRILNFRKWDPD